MQVAADALRGEFADAEDLGLESAAFGDVADDAGEELPAADGEFADREVDGEQAAVLPLAEHLAADADDAPVAGGVVVGEVTIVLGPVGFGHQDVDVAADEFRGRPAKHRFGGRVDGVDAPPVVDGDDALDGGGEDGPKAGFAFAEGGDGLAGIWSGTHEGPGTGIKSAPWARFGGLGAGKGKR